MILGVNSVDSIITLWVMIFIMSGMYALDFIGTEGVKFCQQVKKAKRRIEKQLLK